MVNIDQGWILIIVGIDRHSVGPGVDTTGTTGAVAESVGVGARIGHAVTGIARIVPSIGTSSYPRPIDSPVDYIKSCIHQSQMAGRTP